MATLRELLASRSNDYTRLEHRYQAVTGASLLFDVLEGPAPRAGDLTTTASVLIGAYNSATSLEKTLASLEACSFNQRDGDLLEVIVVDDGSTDGTRELVCDRAWDVNLVYVRQAHAGLTVAHNTGLAFAGRDVVVFSDADLVHTPLAIEQLIARHAPLDGVTLVGFRFELNGADPRLDVDAIRSGRTRLAPAFHDDFRVSFPGWPSNLCLATDHLKAFGHGRTLRLSNGAAYDLPSAVVGAFFSIRRTDYLRMGGSDERLTGWGCEDSLIGARSLALGNCIVPVYSAASGHISHPRRTANEEQEFTANIATANRILDEPFAADVPFPAERYRARAEIVVERRRSGRGLLRNDAGAACATAGGIASDAALADRAKAAFRLGRHDRALADYSEAVRQAPCNVWHRLGQAQALRELGGVQESLEAFDAAAALDASVPWVPYERGFARAVEGDYGGAREDMSAARRLAPDVFDVRWVLQTPSAAHKGRGNHHAARGFHATALRDFDLALIVDDTNCWAHYDRALSLNALERYADALRGLRRTDALLHPQDGNRTWLHHQLGFTCMQLGCANEAKLQLETALALLPSNRTAADHLARLSERGEREHGLYTHLSAIQLASDIEGWLTEAEADLLVAATIKASGLVPPGGSATIVEIGTYCGKSTVVMGATLDALGAPVTLHAIDPHLNYHLSRYADTYALAVGNIGSRGLESRVRVVRARSTEVAWSEPIVLLFVDGLHDYASVLADFRHFAPFVVAGGLVAFHDYFDPCPGVKQCVDELLRESTCEFITHRDRLVVCRMPS